MIALRRMRVRLVTVAACVSSLVASAQAQDGAAAETYPKFMTVTADVAEVHAGADEKYYHFAEVRKGSVVKVVGEKSGWLRVVTVGPAFDAARAYVRHPHDQSSPLKLDAGGEFGRAGGRHDVLGINLRYGSDPLHSWKPIARLQAGQQVRVFGPPQNTNSNVVITIELPENAEGYLNPTVLRDATPAEVSRWETERRAKPAGDQSPRRTPARDEQAQMGPERPDRSDARTKPDPAQGVVARDEQTVPQVDDQPRVADPLSNQVANQAARQPAIDPHRPAEVPTTSTGKGGEVGSAAERLKTLDAKYALLIEEPIETAEVDSLMRLYRQVAGENAEREDIANYAIFRAEQLKLWAQTQRRLAELKSLRTKVDSVGEDTEAAMKVLQSVGAYDAVGRLMASTIYDGRGLPRLFRLQDPATGRTIAYLRPSRDLNVSAMLGQVVGVTGSTNADPGLNVRILNPNRIDILTPQR